MWEVSLLTCGSSIPTVVFRVISDFWEHPTRGDPISALDDLEAHLAKLPRVSRAERGLTDHQPGGLASTSTRYWAAGSSRSPPSHGPSTPTSGKDTPNPTRRRGQLRVQLRKHGDTGQHDTGRIAEIVATGIIEAAKGPRRPTLPPTLCAVRTAGVDDLEARQARAGL